MFRNAYNFLIQLSTSNMQADLPDDSLVRETMASLGPGGKDATLDDLATWIRQLEELCGAAMAPVSFRTDISGTCLSTFPAAGASSQRTGMQTKAVKGYAPLPELHMEKVSSKKKNARGGAKLRLSVDLGPVLVLLTITDIDGATRTLRAVTEDDNNLIPIKHPGTPIEATVVPFTPVQLLERLRRIEAKMKQKREPIVQTSASLQKNVEEASAPDPAAGLRYVKTKIVGHPLEYIFDDEKGTMTIKSSGCPDPYCVEENCTVQPCTCTYNRKTGETEIITDDPLVKANLAAAMKNLYENPCRYAQLSKNVADFWRAQKLIMEQLPTAKPGEKKRLTMELEKLYAEKSKLNDLIYRPDEAAGWMGVPQEKCIAMMQMATQKDPERYDPPARRCLAALEEHVAMREKLRSTSNPKKKKQLTTLMARKEIEFDKAMNEIAAIASGSVQADDRKKLNNVPIFMNKVMGLNASGWSQEGLKALMLKAEQKDPTRAEAMISRCVTAMDEYEEIEEKLKSTWKKATKKRLSKLLGLKEADFFESWTEIAAIADGGKQDGSNELDDLSIRVNEGLHLD